MKKFDFKDVVKKFGEINKAIYGINPYEDPYEDRTQDKLDLQRAEDLEELRHDNYYEN